MNSFHENFEKELRIKNVYCEYENIWENPTKRPSICCYQATSCRPRTETFSLLMTGATPGAFKVQKLYSEMHGSWRIRQESRVSSHGCPREVLQLSNCTRVHRSRLRDRSSPSAARRSAGYLELLHSPLNKPRPLFGEGVPGESLSSSES